ncbi:MAG: Eco57I restriction-modification methylase domain-containing protein [Candidatus Cloacimonetes bacterium]|nr:Eco57I restriction-modification methylase domain-containing protein [Candidatus Cloacimonadota bacterium]
MPGSVNYNPDVLSCLANLSNDEVFTPPEIANAMLDLLPQELFEDPNAKFLDPACKTGVFLREIAKRLITGLEKTIPNLQERIDHIFHEQLYAIAITELTALVARRSTYCSKNTSSIYSVSEFNSPEGNIRYKRIEHTWNGIGEKKDQKCIICGASREQFDRGKELETHAYEFIHEKDIYNMKFDLIIGNPPYQLDTDGPGKQAKPIYHLFVKQALKLKPRFLTMITPSRWFAGGMGLDNYRNEMLNDCRVKRIVDYSMSTDCFPGVDIAGGVSFFLWDREYSGLCQYSFIDNGVETTQQRKLNEFDIFVRDNKAIKIVRKIISRKEKSISEDMSSLGVFGLGTSERGISNNDGNCFSLLSSVGRSFIPKYKVTQGFEYINKWKVIIGKATSAGAATAGKDGKRKVIATLSILEPNAVCTFSYFVGSSFSSEEKAINCAHYLSTKFARFLLLQCLSAINITKERFRFVPIQDFSKKWNDSTLYEKYSLTEEEIDYIESRIKPMDLNGDADA